MPPVEKLNLSELLQSSLDLSDEWPSEEEIQDNTLNSFTFAYKAFNKCFLIIFHNMQIMQTLFGRIHW